MSLIPTEHGVVYLSRQAKRCKLHFICIKVCYENHFGITRSTLIWVIFTKAERKDHEDVIKWKNFPCYCPFVRGINRSPVNSPQRGQWCGALMFSLICAWIDGWVNNREAGDLRLHWTHYDVTVMITTNARYMQDVLYVAAFLLQTIVQIQLMWILIYIYTYIIYIIYIYIYSHMCVRVFHVCPCY